MGAVFVRPFGGVIITALIAAAETGYVSYSTMTSMLKRALLAETD